MCIAGLLPMPEKREEDSTKAAFHLAETDVGSSDQVSKQLCAAQLTLCHRRSDRHDGIKFEASFRPPPPPPPLPNHRLTHTDSTTCLLAHLLADSFTDLGTTHLLLQCKLALHTSMHLVTLNL